MKIRRYVILALLMVMCQIVFAMFSSTPASTQTRRDVFVCFAGADKMIESPAGEKYDATFNNGVWDATWLDNARQQYVRVRTSLPCAAIVYNPGVRLQ